MIRRIHFLLALACASFAAAEPTYIALYVQGSKIGYVETSIAEATLEGRKLQKSVTKTVMGAGLLGQAVNIEIESVVWSDSAGRPVRMTVLMSSGGRVQDIEARIGATEAQVTVKNGANVSTKSLKVPSDGRLVDDALTALMETGTPPGRAASFYVLDPVTVTFVKNTVKVVGKSRAIVKGLEFDATLIEVAEPRATVRVFLSAKGDLIKAEGPMGIEMIPVSKEDALREEPSHGRLADLAVLSSIRPDKPLGDPASLERVKLRFVGPDLGGIPTGGHQTVTKDGEGWIVEVHPVSRPIAGSLTVAAASKGAPEWVKPGLHIPSDSPEFRRLAASLVGSEAHPVAAAERVRQYVTGMMKPNAGIGVLRDASEVLRTKEGVCRDYAILTATLLRAANIPARVASGLVYDQGAFYYHAWVEAYDGQAWFGVDSTRPDGKVTAGHVKLAQGSVEGAFLFTFLDRTSVKVLESKRKG